MWLRTKARISKVQSVSKDTIRMDLAAPEIAAESTPGQFIHILCGEHEAPFLRRPISLHTIDKQSGQLGLLFRVVGKGTSYLAALKAGSEVDLMGPLGHGWPSLDDVSIIMVAGGIGVAPMPAAALRYSQEGLPVTFLYGARTKHELYGIGEVQAAGIPLNLATDDGTEGHHGFVTDLLKEEFGKRAEVSRLCVLACGPAPMLRVVQSMCQDKGAKCYVSLEQRMACGVGACLGCTVKTTLDKPKYMKVCVDGPVFSSETVVIENV